MGTLAVISDLHVDINQLFDPHLQLIADYLQQNQVTHLHLAGDVANKKQRLLDVVAFFKVDRCQRPFTGAIMKWWT